MGALLAVESEGIGVRVGGIEEQSHGGRRWDREMRKYDSSDRRSKVHPLANDLLRVDETIRTKSTKRE